MEEVAGVIDFAAAVASFREALARFDAPTCDDGNAPEPNRLDWNAIRERTVIAEELALERDLGRTSRSGDGGGEQRGPDDGRAAALPAAMFRPPRARIRDAIRRLGTATSSEVNAEAGTSGRYTGMLLVKMQKQGLVRCDGSYPRRWTWVGPTALAPADRELVDEAADLMACGMTPTKVCQRFRAERRQLAGRDVTPAWLMAALRMNEPRPRVQEVQEAAPAAGETDDEGETDEAADEPREVRKMARGTNVTEERVLSAMDGYESSTPEGIAGRLGCGPEAVAICLRGLRKGGRVTSARGPGKGGPMVWTIGGSKPGAAPKKADRAPTKKAKRQPAAAPSSSLAALLEREVQREAKRLAVAILRAHAESIEAELAGSAA